MPKNAREMAIRYTEDFCGTLCRRKECILNLNRRKMAARKWYIVKHLGRNFRGGCSAPVKFCAKLISGVTVAYCQANDSRDGGQETRWHRVRPFEELLHIYVHT